MENNILVIVITLINLDYLIIKDNFKLGYTIIIETNKAKLEDLYILLIKSSSIYLSIDIL